MTTRATHEAEVSARFDALRNRFKAEVAADDPRLVAVARALGSAVSGGRLLDLGSGKGRFAARLQAMGAEVVGLDVSAGMLAASTLGLRVRGSARRLPLRSASFDGVLAIEVLEHLSPFGWPQALREVRRVLRPGAAVAIVDKNAAALDPRRPWLPALAIKRIDEHRGRWMYRPGGPVKERWFWPGQVQRLLRAAGFVGVAAVPIPVAEEAEWAVFRARPGLGRFVLWTGTAPGAEAHP